MKNFTRILGGLLASVIIHHALHILILMQYLGFLKTLQLSPHRI